MFDQTIRSILGYLENGIAPTHEQIGVDKSTWELRLIELQVRGIVQGVSYTQTMSDRPIHVIDASHAHLTERGRALVADTH